MGKGKKLVVAGGVAAAVGLGAYFQEEITDFLTVPQEPATFTRIEDISKAREAAGDSINFWQQQGIGKRATINVVELDGNATFNCGPNPIHSYDDFAYCNVKDKNGHRAVVLPAAAVNSVRDRHQETPKAGDAALAGAVRIATAEYVLINKPELLTNLPKTGDAEKNNQNKFLLQACIAGIEQADVDRSGGVKDSPAVHDYIIKSDGWKYETPKDRISFSFKNGYTESERRSENGLSAPFDPSLCLAPSVIPWVVE